MAEKQFVLDLAKLVIAVAWADGTLVNEELNAVKDLLFADSRPDRRGLATT
jgi:hypothetical protein